MNGHSYKPFNSIIFHYGITPAEERKSIFQNLFSKNEKCLNYHQDQHFIVAKYINCLEAAHIMATQQFHHYSITHHVDDLEFNPNILEINGNLEEATSLIDNYGGVILDQQTDNSYIYYRRFLTAAKIYTTFKHPNIEIQFAYNDEVQPLMEMFEIEVNL